MKSGVQSAPAPEILPGGNIVKTQSSCLERILKYLRILKADKMMPIQITVTPTIAPKKQIQPNTEFGPQGPILTLSKNTVDNASTKSPATSTRLTKVPSLFNEPPVPKVKMAFMNRQ